MRSVQSRVDVMLDRIARKPLKGAWLASAVVTATVTAAAGLLIRLTDPDTFGSTGSGLWWAVQTITTVGYGDVVPASPAGRLVATAIMIAGIGFITVSTAAIASAFVEASRRRREAAEPDRPDLAGLLEAQTREIAALREEVAALRDQAGLSRPAAPGPGPAPRRPPGS